MTELDFIERNENDECNEVNCNESIGKEKIKIDHPQLKLAI